MLEFSILLLGLAYTLLSHDSRPLTGTENKALILAAFGTSSPENLTGIVNVYDKTINAFPDIRVELTFTSPTIRNIWRRRQNNPEWIDAHPGVPSEVLSIKSPLAAIGQLHDEGYRHIVVQPLHVHAGEEYINLAAMIDALNSVTTIKPKHQPFDRLILSRPALGRPGPSHPYQEDIASAVAALEPDAKRARELGAALVYAGHGNEYNSSGVYLEFEDAFRRVNPDLSVFVGVVEGFPGLDRVMRGLKHVGAKRVLLVPLLLVAGYHALEDMTGNHPDSWKNIMEAAGLEVSPLMRGLGDVDAWADLYVRHIKDALADHDPA